MEGLSVAAPADMSQLRALFAATEGPMTFIAGGTDMLIARRPPPAGGLLIDLSRIAGMAFISTDSGDIRIGGATTVAAIAADHGLRARLPALAEAAAQCGSVQIRNRATIGGNIANAAPAADLLPVLVAAGARLECIGRDGASCELAICGYAPDRGHLIAEVILPRSGLLPRSAFVKLGPRQDLSISRLNIALLAEFRDDHFGNVRIAAGALGPRPLRLPLAEAALVGKELAPATLRDFLSALTAEVDAAIPGRGSQAYKRRAIAGLGLNLVAQALGLSPREHLFEDAAR
ncbi:FAD binding domain-containing protein [Mesorhizobium sp. M2C.T.Ca.TU.002.02.1.1]|uniref:FAD binding domain-containing protein n=1 Tax=Mesorhizobium sp. M2C.T.Ca.TU.002.02.1.1 TaxID=2496788 RepID=UPI000FCC4DE7|nr:FAD binding domain-containing protein [Mesorhizobium sp. M2C.T.Ca.TU.002.02.1.1]RUU57548.1 molybdopterin dehydrogenase [Mesorhizobium sp. M2C.T.Ca.TU.002.02.1.1]RUU71451.1 molybdopterin dehydrogenase [Mesorhizobium sp. M2C.T.Ca.TU.009.01.2.1]